MLRIWSCFVLKNLVGCIVIFHFGLKMYFDIELEKCIATLERFEFHKEKNCRTCELGVDAIVIIWNFRGADVNNEEIGIVEDNSSLSAIYKRLRLLLSLVSWYRG